MIGFEFFPQACPIKRRDLHYAVLVRYLLSRRTGPSRGCIPRRCTRHFGNVTSLSAPTQTGNSLRANSSRAASLQRSSALCRARTPAAAKSGWVAFRRKATHIYANFWYWGLHRNYEATGFNRLVAANGFADRRRVGPVILLPTHIRLNISGRDQPDLMPEPMLFCFRNGDGDGQRSLCQGYDLKSCATHRSKSSRAR